MKKLEQIYTLGDVNFDSVIIIDFGSNLKSILTSLVFTDVNQDKVLFTRAFTLVASIFFIPVLFFVEPLPPEAYSFFIITLIIHTLYKFFLCRVYDNSELSYGYPLARGTPSLIVLFVTPLIFSDDLTKFAN